MSLSLPVKCKNLLVCDFIPLLRQGNVFCSLEQNILFFVFSPRKKHIYLGFPFDDPNVVTVIPRVFDADRRLRRQGSTADRKKVRKFFFNLLRMHECDRFNPKLDFSLHIFVCLACSKTLSFHPFKTT